MVLLHGPLAPAMRLGSTQRAERRKHLHAPVLLGVLLLLPLLESRPTGASSIGAGPLAADGPAALVPKTWDISRFGAVGDGKTNNTAVVRAAAAALREAAERRPGSPGRQAGRPHQPVYGSPPPQGAPTTPGSEGAHNPQGAPTTPGQAKQKWQVKINTVRLTGR